MGTPREQQFFDECLNFEDGGGYGFPNEADGDDGYSAQYPAQSAWDAAPDLMQGGHNPYLDPYEQALDPYDVPETETNTSDTRSSAAAASDGWSGAGSRSQSKSSKSSAPSTVSGASTSKHRKKHHSSTASSHHHHDHGSSTTSHHHGRGAVGGSGKEKSGHGKEKSSGKDKSNKSKEKSGSSTKDKGSSKEKGRSKAAGPSTSSGGGSGSASHGGGDDGGEVPERRDKFLERNRIAASKCRQKKKEWVNDLEDQKYGLETQNSHLQMEYNGLLGEVSRMKNQIMAHAGCNDANIDKWIQNEARRFVQAESDRYDREQHGYPGPPSAGMYPMSAATPSYASSSYQNDDVASQMSPTDPSGFDGGSVYGEAPAAVADSRHRHGHGHRRGSGHR